MVTLTCYPARIQLIGKISIWLTRKVFQNNQIINWSKPVVSPIFKWRCLIDCNLFNQPLSVINCTSIQKRFTVEWKILSIYWAAEERCFIFSIPRSIISVYASHGWLLLHQSSQLLAPHSTHDQSDSGLQRLRTLKSRARWSLFHVQIKSAVKPLGIVLFLVLRCNIYIVRVPFKY